jgi:hypothetical protein
MYRFTALWLCRVNKLSPIADSNSESHGHADTHTNSYSYSNINACTRYAIADHALLLSDGAARHGV